MSLLAVLIGSFLGGCVVGWVAFGRGYRAGFRAGFDAAMGGIQAARSLALAADAFHRLGFRFGQRPDESE